MTFLFFLCNLNSPKRRKGRTSSLSFCLAYSGIWVSFIQGKTPRALAEALGCDCWHSPWHSVGSCQPAAPRDFPATVLGTAVPPTAPKWQFEHHQFVLGGRKLRYKDMGSVRSLASGHMRIFDSFWLNLARESLARASKLPALSCWRQIPRGTGGKHRSGKTSWFCKPWYLQNQEDHGLGESLQNYSVTSTSHFILFSVLHRFPWKLKLGIIFKKAEVLDMKIKKPEALDFDFYTWLYKGRE